MMATGLHDVGRRLAGAGTAHADRKLKPARGTLNGTPKLTKFRISKFSVQAITRISVDKLILKQQIGLCRSYHRTAMMAGF